MLEAVSASRKRPVLPLNPGRVEDFALNKTNDAALLELAAELGRSLLSRSLKLATAESCTGGWIAK
ncbi:MAG: CinA family protein, partial [Gammaproteobacteria bacterium]